MVLDYKGENFMYKKYIFISLFVFIIFFLADGKIVFAEELWDYNISTSEGDANSTNPYIIDLDFCTDVDDVCAVRIATTLDKIGKIDLMAVMLNTTGENNISALHGLLSYDGYSSLPIGSSSLNIPDTSPYWDDLSTFSPGNINVNDSVRLYRKILSKSDSSVTIITTGYLTNIAELMESGPDDISELTGEQLINEKAILYIVGGAFPEGFCNNFFFEDESISAIKYIVDNCKAPIYFVTSDVGGPISCGKSIQQDPNYRNDPVSIALYDFGTTNGRAAWDPFGVWVSAFSTEETKTYIKKTNLLVDDNGMNHFFDDENSRFFRIGRLSDDINWYSEQLDSLLYH